MRTILILFTRMNSNSRVCADVDVSAVNAALKAIHTASHRGMRLAVQDIGCIPLMYEVLARNRDDAPEVISLADKRACLDFALTQPLDAVVVLGGDEDCLEIAHVAGARPDVTLLPVVSTGGAARVLFRNGRFDYPEGLAHAADDYVCLFERLFEQLSLSPVAA